MGKEHISHLSTGCLLQQVAHWLAFANHILPLRLLHNHLFTPSLTHYSILTLALSVFLPFPLHFLQVSSFPFRNSLSTALSCILQHRCFWNFSSCLFFLCSPFTPSGPSLPHLSTSLLVLYHIRLFPTALALYPSLLSQESSLFAFMPLKIGTLEPLDPSGEDPELYTL